MSLQKSFVFHWNGRHHCLCVVQVYQILHSEQYYEAFLQSSVYLKMLQEMGLSKPDKPEDGDTSSLDEGRLPVNGNQIIKPQNQILHIYINGLIP